MRDDDVFKSLPKDVLALILEKTDNPTKTARVNKRFNSVVYSRDYKSKFLAISSGKIKIEALINAAKDSEDLSRVLVERLTHRFSLNQLLDIATQHDKLRTELLSNKDLTSVLDGRELGLLASGCDLLRDPIFDDDDIWGELEDKIEWNIESMPKMDCPVTLKRALGNDEFLHGLSSEELLSLGTTNLLMADKIVLDSSLIDKIDNKDRAKVERLSKIYNALPVQQFKKENIQETDVEQNRKNKLK
tara:strand:- start:2024 stop:2761 length:738 start_codon:yes stop_codon:yes gene_type:complete